MNIIYPSLVEQAYAFAKAQGVDITKEEMYKMQVKEGFLTETGEPTQKAINEGLVASYSQTHDTLKQFKHEYPIFKDYPKSEFTQQKGIWYVSQKILDDIVAVVDSIGYDETQQISTYMNFRNYDNPHGSIAETKGVYHPLYTPYDDSLFQVVNGKVAAPQSVIEDMARRADEGELDIDSGILKQLLEGKR